jgi:hypothetical protein
VAYDQDQEIVERRLAATAFGERFADQKVANRLQRRMRRERRGYGYLGEQQ